jgi:hypothetical protein
MTGNSKKLNVFDFTLTRIVAHQLFVEMLMKMNVDKKVCFNFSYFNGFLED